MAKITRIKLKRNKTNTKIVITVKTKFWFITVRKLHYFDTISESSPSVLEKNTLRECFISCLELIRSPLKTRKIRIHTALFLEPTVKQRKLKCAKILSKTPGEDYSASEVARIAKHTHLQQAYQVSFLVFSFSCLPHETCLNSFQNTIPFLSRRNKSYESIDIPQAFQFTKLILN